MLSEGRAEAGGIAFGVVQSGTGPLALCLHGFPDSAWTWRRLLPALAPERWRRPVTIGVPPLTLDERLFADYEQFKRFFHLFLLKSSHARSVLAANDMAFVEQAGHFLHLEHPEEVGARIVRWVVG